MTKCSNCGSPQGPFRAVKGFPGKRICVLKGKNVEPLAREKRVRECLALRDKVDGGKQ